MAVWSPNFGRSDYCRRLPALEAPGALQRRQDGALHHQGQGGALRGMFSLPLRDLDQSKEPVRCTRSFLLGILGVRNVGNTALWTFLPLVYCTTHLEDASGTLQVGFRRITGVYTCIYRYFPFRDWCPLRVCSLSDWLTG
eukprot:8525734-Pyramimonas_sp.AAC.1